MGDKVYIVTQGSYSDYHIVSVFADKEQAYTFCAIHNDKDLEDTNYWGGYEIEEWDIDTIKIETNEKPKKKVKVWFKKYRYDEPPKYYEYYEAITLQQDTDNISLWSDDGCRIEYEIEFVVDMNKDKEQCKKIATDKLMQYLAGENGL